MKILAALFLFTGFLSANPARPGRGLPPPEILADRPAAKVVDRMTFRNDMAVVPISGHRISAHFPDGLTRPLLEFRTRFRSSARASVSREGHIAISDAGAVRSDLSPEELAQAKKEGHRSSGRGGLILFPSPDYKPVNIVRIRSDRHARHLPAIGDFTIEDTAWGDGFLACAGYYVINEMQKGPPGRAFQVRFISRILIDPEGNPRDHQILWASLQPEHLKGTDFPVFPGSGYGMVPHTLHVQGDRIFWRNLGDLESQTAPNDEIASIKRCLWRTTSLKTGRTEASGSSPADKEKLRRIDAELAKRLEGQAHDFLSARQVAFLKEALGKSLP